MNRLKKRPIGIFDSGVGGLTVFREIERILPYEDIVYFGDTARVPYGNKSRETIVRFSMQNILFLLKKKVKIVVVACNTSSSLSLEYLKNIFRVPVIGVISPSVEKALLVSKTRKIGVIATRSTINSGTYEQEIIKKDKKVQVHSLACPLFVPLVEEGMFPGKILDEVIKFYLEAIKQKVDTLILGCTHYPLLKESLVSFLKGVLLIDSAEEVAVNAKAVLEQNNLSNNKLSPSKEFYVSDDPGNFLKMATLFLERKVSKPKVVNV